MQGARPRVAATAALLVLASMLAGGPLVAADERIATTTPEVRDLAEILEGEVVVVVDPGGRSATIEVTTTIDVACAVVFGPDGSFGRIATDADMGGGAHREHRPVLGGLEPGSTVHFRVQGSGPDGTLYVGETRTFRLPEADVDGPLNLALGATVVEASSEFSAAFAAAHAIDGDPTTAWSSAGDGDDAFITLDLGQEAAIGAVRFVTRSMADGSSVTETFALTVDGRTIGAFPADEVVAVEVTGRVLRFDVEASTGGNTGALEIEVLAADGP
jgi:hypothetical protein